MQTTSHRKDLAMGHEVFGEVVELGENVKDLEIGKKYVVYPGLDVVSVKSV